MQSRNVKLEQPFDRDAEEQAKLQWLRAAVKVGLDQIERGESMEFASIEELQAEIGRIWDEVERTRA